MSHRFSIKAHLQRRVRRAAISLVGLLAGALSGYFIQLLVLTVVTGSGSLNEPRNLDIFVIEGLTGMVVGGIAMAAVGMLLQGRRTPNS
jgi:uncharacterized membrane protein YjgN (DUF898 family)